MRTRICMIPLILLLTSAGFAQSFWQKKTPQEWSVRECEKLLTDSPWAKSKTIGDVLIEDLEKSASVDGREGNPWVTYTARFWSALPVRQAFVRQTQASREFLSLAPEQKRSVDEQNSRVLGAEFPDHIVLIVTIASNVESYKRDLLRVWQARPASQWAMDTFLMAGKNRVPPLDVRVATEVGMQLQIRFPRILNRQAIVDPGVTSLSLELVHPNVGVLRSERLLFTFKVKEMMLGGVAIY
jgi:hypothetical protein